MNGSGGSQAEEVSHKQRCGEKNWRKGEKDQMKEREEGVGDGTMKRLRQRQKGLGFPSQGLKLDQMQRTMDLKDLRKGGGGSLVVRSDRS